mmetsp:Transcript_39358/g.95255  ORF Transcript_39358/g.95255 Transcript_39358/m.95255 type:complete len:247 (+) Transcript_39358:1121-1861(+)
MPSMLGNNSNKNKLSVSSSNNNNSSNKSEAWALECKPSNNRPCRPQCQRPLWLLLGLQRTKPEYNRRTLECFHPHESFQTHHVPLLKLVQQQHKPHVLQPNHSNPHNNNHQRPNHNNNKVNKATKLWNSIMPFPTLPPSSVDSPMIQAPTIPFWRFFIHTKRNREVSRKSWSKLLVYFKTTQISCENSPFSCPMPSKNKPRNDSNVLPPIRRLVKLLPNEPPCKSLPWMSTVPARPVVARPQSLLT